VEAVLAYLELEDAKALRYKMQACGKLMDEAPLVRHVTRSGGHMHDGHIHVGNAHEDMRQLYERPTVDRAGTLFRRKKRKGRFRMLEGPELDKVLRRAFQLYSSGRHKRGRGDHYMEESGFLHCLRDCQVLDNKFTLHWAQGLVSKLAFRFTSADGKLNIGDFEMLLRELSAFKFRKAPTLEDAYSMLLSMHIAPYVKLATIPDEDLSCLLQPEVLDVFARYEAGLKKVYAHYATLGLVSFHHSTWSAVQRANRCMLLDEFVTFLLNFEVLPALVNKHDVTEIFQESNHDIYFPEEQPLGYMTYPQFLECVGRCALHVIGNLESKIKSKMATVTELNAFKKLVTVMPAEGERVHFNNMLAQRRAAARHLPPQELREHLEARAAKMESDRQHQEKAVERARRSITIVLKEEAAMRSNRRKMHLRSLSALSGAPDPSEGRLRSRFKQVHLGVTMKTMNSYMQKEIESLSHATEDGADIRALDEFEKRLDTMRGTWNRDDEMKGWTNVGKSRTVKSLRLRPVANW